MAGGLEGDYFVGKDIDNVRGLLKLHYPMEHGIGTWIFMYADRSVVKSLVFKQVSRRSGGITSLFRPLSLLRCLGYL